MLIKVSDTSKVSDTNQLQHLVKNGKFRKSKPVPGNRCHKK